MRFPFLLEEEEWEPALWEQSKSGLSIYEDNNNFYVEASLPGLSAEDIEVTYEGGTLWIKGEKKEEEKDTKKKYFRKALSSFSYSARLPGPIDENKEINAEYKNGIMKITFSKRKESKTQKIKIKKK